MRFLVLFFALILSACGKEPLVQTKSYVFGTLVDISIYGESKEKAHAVTSHILQDFQRLHHQYHAWQSDSELSKLNQTFAVGKQPVEISPELGKMLAQAQTLSKESQGLFEIRVEESSNIYRVFCFFDDGAVVILINGFQKKTDKTPRSEIARAQRLRKKYYHEKEETRHQKFW